MLNIIAIEGRLVRDPEKRMTGSGTAVTSFTLAVDRDIKPKDAEKAETDFLECVAWGKTAEFVAKYFTKGQMAVVKGRLQIRQYTDKNEQKRRSAEIFTEVVYFCGTKESGAQSRSVSERASETVQTQMQAQNFDPITDFDGGLPY